MGVKMMAWDAAFGSAVAERKPRRAYLVKAECENADGQIVFVRIRNLSATGMGGVVEKGLNFVNDEAIKLCFRGQRKIAGKVIWVRAKSFGVTFDRAINPEEILAGITQVGQTFAVDPMHQVEDRCWRPAPSLDGKH
jgi:PilZ domain